MYLKIRYSSDPIHRPDRDRCYGIVTSVNMPDRNREMRCPSPRAPHLSVLLAESLPLTPIARSAQTDFLCRRHLRTAVARHRLLCQGAYENPPIGRFASEFQVVCAMPRRLPCELIVEYQTPQPRHARDHTPGRASRLNFTVKSRRGAPME